MVIDALTAAARGLISCAEKGLELQANDEELRNHKRIFTKEEREAVAGAFLDEFISSWTKGLSDVYGDMFSDLRNDSETVVIPDDHGTQYNANDMARIITASTYLKAIHIHCNNHGNVVTGSFYDDAIYGGVGSDLIIGNFGNDTILGDVNSDINGYSDTPNTVYPYTGNSLSTLGASDTLYGGADADKIFGGNENDLIYGDGTLIRDSSRDGKISVLTEETPADGNDTLYGELGNDTINSGEGNDSLKGGKDGYNVFSYGSGDEKNTAHGNDTIADYDDGDIIRLLNVTVLSHSTKGDDVIIYVKNSGGENTITVQDAADKDIVLVDKDGKRSTIKSSAEDAEGKLIVNDFVDGLHSRAVRATIL